MNLRVPLLGKKIVIKDNNDNKRNSNYTLGSLPWGEEDLKIAYFSDFSKIRKNIKEHPGFLAHQALESIRLSLDIFLDSFSDLIKSIDLFIKESKTPDFWARAKKERFKKLELSIRRGVFSVATSAMALVNNSRNINKKFTLSDYQLQINNTFDSSGEHRFIQGLRNFVNHYKMIETDWKVSWSKSGKHIQFLLYPKKLLCWDKWTSLAKRFIKQSPQGVDVKRLFENYKIQVEEFHCWFHVEIEKLSQPELSEYRKYEHLLNKLDTKSFWNVILNQAISNKKINPYKYLNRYLTKPELDEVFSLPMNSQAQIDRIIKILDEYGACDNELRQQIYKVFNVNNLSK